MKARTAAAGLGGVALLAGLYLFWQPTEPTVDRPNVLVIVWDTVRADRLSLYGHDRVTTPWLESFADEAVVFERAISPAMWTPPSHGSMFTGFAPHHHGVKATYKWLDAHHTTLAEHLGAHGYGTFSFSANPYVSPDTNLTQGFDVVANSFSAPWRRSARISQQRKLVRADASSDISPAWRGKRTVGKVHLFKDAAPVADEALNEWLAQRDDPEQPWFAFINMMEAHIPRIPSMKSRKALLDPEMLQLGLNTEVSQMDLLSYTFGVHDYTDAEIEAIRGVYDAALLDLDRATGDLIDGLRKKGLLDDTIVVITADHGENLGDHHMFGHKFSLWDTLIHVPLIVWYPPELEPARVDHVVSNLGLFPTLLDLTEVPEPSTGVDWPHGFFDGAHPDTVFSQLIESTPISIGRVDREHGLDDVDRWLRTFRASVSDGWKLIEASDGEQQLFHVDEDPGELEDVAADHGERVERLSDAVDAWVAGIPEYDPSGRTAADEPPDIDRIAKKNLAALGYLDEGDEDDTDAVDTD